MVDAVPNSGRPVAPEPTTTTTMGTWCPPPAGENSASGGRQPTLAQPSSIATAEDARPTESAKPAERAEAAAPPAAESAAAEPPTEYIGPTENIGPMKAIGRAWEEPAHLLLQLEKLKKQEVAQAWATEASAAIRKLGPAISVGAPGTAEILQHLEQLTGEAPSLATKVGNQALALDLAQDRARPGPSDPGLEADWPDGRHGRRQRPAAGRRSAGPQQVPQRHRSAHGKFVGRAGLAEVLADRALARLGGTQAQQPTSGCRATWPSRCSRD